MIDKSYIISLFNYLHDKLYLYGPLGAQWINHDNKCRLSGKCKAYFLDNNIYKCSTILKALNENITDKKEEKYVKLLINSIIDYYIYTKNINISELIYLNIPLDNFLKDNKNLKSYIINIQENEDFLEKINYLINIKNSYNITNYPKFKLNKNSEIDNFCEELLAFTIKDLKNIRFYYNINKLNIGGD